VYDAFKEMLLEIFRAPSGPPDPPAGSHDSVQVFRASPNFLRYQLLLATAILLVVGLAGFVGGIVLLIQEPLFGALALVLLGIAWFLVFISVHFIIRLEYDMRHYIITDRSMRIRKGAWSILEQTLTFVNIQNISVEQGPLERMFGISRLVVDTAGGGGSAASQQQGAPLRNYHQAVLNGLENADEIRDLIVNYLKKLPHSGGLGAPDDAHRQDARERRFSQEEIDALREILAEAQSLRSCLASR
jgi:membrane protein YdbS with pleckstrin-like domain